MMKKNAFTLIELLAVIVILAIIALIATPIVLNIINDTKESAQLRSAEFYLDAVEQAIMRKNMSSVGMFKPNKCDIQSDGNLECEGYSKPIKVEVSGEVPKGGFIKFDNGKIGQIKLIMEDDKNIIKNSKGELEIDTSLNIIEVNATYTWVEDGDVGSGIFTLSECFDESKFLDKSNYRMTISDANNTITYDLMSTKYIDTEQGNKATFVLWNNIEPILYLARAQDNHCYLGVEESLGLSEKVDIEIEYIDSKIDPPHVLRVGSNDLEIFSTEMPEGSVSLLFESDGNTETIQTTASLREGYTRIKLGARDYLQTIQSYYQLLQSGKTFTVTVTQGDYSYKFEGNFNATENIYDCNLGNETYYYLGNNELGNAVGC